MRSRWVILELSLSECADWIKHGRPNDISPLESPSFDRQPAAGNIRPAPRAITRSKKKMQAEIRYKNMMFNAVISSEN